jgi:hypothetical protein
MFKANLFLPERQRWPAPARGVTGPAGSGERSGGHVWSGVGAGETKRFLAYKQKINAANGVQTQI